MHSTTHPLNPKQSNLKGLGIEIPPQPRGARHQPTYSSVVANQYAQQPHEIQPQQVFTPSVVRSYLISSPQREDGSEVVIKRETRR